MEWKRDMAVSRGIEVGPFSNPQNLPPTPAMEREARKPMPRVCGAHDSVKITADCAARCTVRDVVMAQVRRQGHKPRSNTTISTGAHHASHKVSDILRMRGTDYLPAALAAYPYPVRAVDSPACSWRRHHKYSGACATTRLIAWLLCFNVS
jgi:hypothetical protein